MQILGVTFGCASTVCTRCNDAGAGWLDHMLDAGRKEVVRDAEEFVRAFSAHNIDVMFSTAAIPYIELIVLHGTSVLAHNRREHWQRRNFHYCCLVAFCGWNRSMKKYLAYKSDSKFSPIDTVRIARAKEHRRRLLRETLCAVPTARSHAAQTTPKIEIYHKRNVPWQIGREQSAETSCVDQITASRATTCTTTKYSPIPVPMFQLLHQLQKSIFIINKREQEKGINGYSAGNAGLAAPARPSRFE